METAKCSLSYTALCALAAGALGLLGMSALLTAVAVKSRCIKNKCCPVQSLDPDAE